jgi:LAS superfamily LD-carboxypeptidase LdcB
MLTFLRISVLLSLIFISCKTDADVPEQVIQTVTDSLKEPEISLDFVMGKFDPGTHPDFVIIDKQYADKEGLYLQKEAYESFLKMREAAMREGITLVIRSATRNFDYQKGIWERKWKGETKLEEGINASEVFPDPVMRAKKILEYSSMPGSSRHHWGTDIDLNDFENEWFEKGEGLILYKWMQKHASEFGFCQPYSKRGEQRPNGYNEEKWHWSYIPLAKRYTDAAEKDLRDSMLQGFDGAVAAEAVHIVQYYVLGINKACL